MHREISRSTRATASPSFPTSHVAIAMRASPRETPSRIEPPFPVKWVEPLHQHVAQVSMIVHMGTRNEQSVRGTAHIRPCIGARGQLSDGLKGCQDDIPRRSTSCAMEAYFWPAKYFR